MIRMNFRLSENDKKALESKKALIKRFEEQISSTDVSTANGKQVILRLTGAIKDLKKDIAKIGNPRIIR